MKLYGLNNIVRCGSYIYYIDIVGERLHLKNESPYETLYLYGVTLDDDEKDLIEDVEMSDFLLDALFKKHFYYECQELYYWELGTGKYSIEKVDEDLYKLMIGSNILVYFNTVRELQNAYHFYSDYDHEENVLTEDIDTKLKKLFKLI